MVLFIGPLLRREMITSVRCARVLSDRLIALLLVTGSVTGCVVVWDEWSWDRTSVSEAAWFALVAFGLAAVAQAGIAFGLVVGSVAPCREFEVGRPTRPQADTRARPWERFWGRDGLRADRLAERQGR
jgi:hypothetical protein